MGFAQYRWPDDAMKTDRTKYHGTSSFKNYMDGIIPYM